MATVKRGSVQINYDSSNVADVVADEMAEIIQKVSFDYPNDSFYNLAYPSVKFELTKLPDGSGYQLTNSLRNLADPYIQFIKRAYHALNRKYKVSMVFMDSKGKVTLNYSDDKYLGILLRNHMFSTVLIPVVTVVCLSLLGRWMPSAGDESFWGRVLREVIPVVVGLPISFVAFKLQPMIPATKVMSCALIFITVFLFYLFSGSGLVGSLILLAIFILQSIQNNLT